MTRWDGFLTNKTNQNLSLKVLVKANVWKLNLKYREITKKRWSVVTLVSNWSFRPDYAVGDTNLTKTIYY